MKKKLIIFLLCVLTVLSIGVMLAACNDNGNADDGIEGNYLGYVEGESKYQLHVNIVKIHINAQNKDVYRMWFYEAEYDTSPILVYPAHFVETYCDFELDSTTVYITPSCKYYFPEGEYSISDLVDGKMTLTGKKIVHLKKTDLEKKDFHGFHQDGSPYYYEED